MTTLTGKVALVTGGSRGLGMAIVLGLAEAGADLAFCYRQNTAAAEAVAARVESLTGRPPFYAKADVTKEQERRALISEICSRMGAPAILVNNAGNREDSLAVRMRQAWDLVLELDLTAPFRLCQLVLPAMMRHGWGRIINIGSIASRIGIPGQANYTTAKAGLEGLTRTLAQEYGRKGITVNTVNPGFMETDLTKGASQTIMDYALARSALQKFPTPQAVASLVVFLASEPAWAITGQTINVDCGLIKT